MARHSDSGLTSWIDSRVAIRAGKGEPAAARVGWRGCRRLRMLRLHAARPGLRPAWCTYGASSLS